MGDNWDLASITDAATAAAVIDLCGGQFAPNTTRFWVGIFDAAPGTRNASKTDLAYQQWLFSSPSASRSYFLAQQAALWTAYNSTPDNLNGAEDCVEVYNAEPTAMYGGAIRSGTESIPVLATSTDNVGNKVYIAFEIYTKLVNSLGSAKYYAGPISSYLPASWPSYTNYSNFYLLAPPPGTRSGLNDNACATLSQSCCMRACLRLTS